MACWYLDASPLSVSGTCGKGRDYIGNCSDHFSLIYQFPKNILLSFSSKQYGYGFDDIMCRVYGVNGTVDAHYFSKSTIRTKDQSFNGDVKNLYVTGAEANIATFHESITKGDYTNPTVAQSVRSNLTTILGRMAAYKNTTVTWDEMMRKSERLAPDLKGLKA
jgi:predicted dehydrogenase